MPAPLTDLQSAWTQLYRFTLPALAKERSLVQKSWPVVLDHCFARIILDNAVGKTQPWTSVLKAPAVKNMSTEQIEAAIELGREIQRGEADLASLDEQSLKLRGKQSKKRKSDITGADEMSPKRSRKDHYADVWSGFTGSKRGCVESKVEEKNQSVATLQGVESPISAPHIDTEKRLIENDETTLNLVRSKIARDTKMTDFRKRVLTLLTQVPRGKYTTYKAMSDAAASSQRDKGTPKASGCARAIGGAMRNNPFAPSVPCHRVLAADGRIGGFKGDWGEAGKFVSEKRRLLHEEGVRFDVKGRAVGEPFTGFA